MKISTTSWHYWLLNKYNANILWQIERGHNVTLCQYFWAVIGGCLLTLAIVVALVFGVLLTLAAIYAFISFIALLLFPYIGFVSWVSYEAGLALTVIMCLFGSFGGIAAGIL